MQVPAFVSPWISYSSDHNVTVNWFLKGLGLIYILAFLSLGSQVMGLFGAQGIFPLSGFIPGLKASLSWLDFPTLFWFSQSQVMLQGVTLAGLFGGLGLLLGIFPFISAFTAWGCYASFVVAGPVFMSFQWDVLLVEVGFLALFLAPWRSGYRHQQQVLYAAILWGRVILFKVMLSSGVIKWISHDPIWRSQTALLFHYVTQPLPHIFSFWAHALPHWVHLVSCVLMFVIECLLPFFMFATIRHRLMAFWGTTFLMSMIFLTGNYGFFNLLMMVLALLLLDDSIFKLQDFGEFSPISPRAWVPVVLCGFFIFISLWDLPFRFLRPNTPSLSARLPVISALPISNAYGLFARMTTSRYELIIEGSMDGQHWKPYIPKYKPYAADIPPKWVQPHQPRLDWQLWFAALSSYDAQPWLDNLLYQLSQNSPEVESLFRDIPFKSAPRYLKISRRHFWFNTLDRPGDVWWIVGPSQSYSPVFEVSPK